MSKGRVPWPSSISSCESLLRKKGKHFKGKADHQSKPGNRTSEDVLNMVKDVQVVFGKGPGSQPVPMMLTDTHPYGKRSPYFGSYPIGKS